MVIISYSAIKDFIEIHPEAMDVCNNWYRLFETADCRNFHELKNLFNSVDAIGNDRYVFNVGGGNYRIIAMIFFDIRTVFIRKVLLHKDYERIKDASLV
jgi:mRNA interferase HigB